MRVIIADIHTPGATIGQVWQGSRAAEGGDGLAWASLVESQWAAISEPQWASLTAEATATSTIGLQVAAADIHVPGAVAGDVWHPRRMTLFGILMPPFADIHTPGAPVGEVWG